jgi:hypothetical protein
MSLPQAYRTARRVWVTTAIAFVGMAVFLFGAEVALGSLAHASLFLPLLPISMLVLILLRLSCWRLLVDDSGFEYRDLIGKSFRLNYSDIVSLTTKSITMGRGSYYQSTLHLRDGRKIRINLFPFGQDVYRLLQRKIHGT